MEKLLFSSFQNIETYRHLRDTLLRYHSLILEPPPISFLALLARTLSDDSFFPVFLFDTERDSEKALEACLAFFPENTVAWLPFYEYGTDLFNKARFENHFARYASLQVQKQLSCLITSPALLNHLVQNPTRTQKSVLTISTGQTFSFTWFQLHLSDIGYERVDLVEHPGEFCIRGGIIDVYPFGSALPFRLEFFGDTINSLRTFNPDSQLSLENQTHLLLFPSSSYSPYTPFLSHLPDKTIFITSSSLSLPENSSFYSLVLSESPKALSFSVLVPPPLRSDFPRKTHILKVAKSYKQLYVFWQSPLLKDQLNEIFHSLTQTTVLFVQGSLPESFVIRDLQTAFVNDTYFFCKEYLFNPDAPFIPNVERITKRDVLKYGDAVVHVDYGIGIYLGTRYADGDEQVILEYDQGDRVYLPVRHLDKIYQFSEGHIEHIHPDSLKRKTWEPKKQRAKKAVIQITDDLLRLYKKRATKKGIAMEGDHVSEKELALSFPWTETHDQELAIKTVKDDLAKPIIMDRLICGDVGFGKTEVALRSAYRAVISGYQVAVLVPTTILSIQHYETFKERLSPLGVSIDILNRFRSDREFKNLCESVVQGKIDILIGTHRLLSKKLFFKNLGLLIIDEEHRFGVHHKERIQHIKSTIDVLSMSATPIPRTLQLSL
ncbi:MAG: DEAD/DEAH box helicase, partial [Candidatus Marinimicrobia bacterium]|nr:DEAD/DEAH box helicase [Candidatus Neomarinimicrobiota bacterium]